MPEPIKLYGLAWYRREDYAQLKAAFEGSEELPGTFNEWLVLAEAELVKRQAAGFITFAVIIDPVQFPVWCEMNNAKICAATRIRYCGLEALRRYRQSN
jgi:hypothetical protein